MEEKKEIYIFMGEEDLLVDTYSTTAMNQMSNISEQISSVSVVKCKLTK